MKPLNEYATPETDAAALRPASNDDSDKYSSLGGYVTVEIARSLERRLAALECTVQNNSTVSLPYDAYTITTPTAFKDMTEQEHLDKIEAKCNACLALAKMRTPGEWHQRANNRIYDTNARQVGTTISPDFLDLQNHQNAAYIAACASAAEAGWLTTISIIRGFREIEYGWQDNEHSKTVRQRAINKLREAWPVNLL